MNERNKYTEVAQAIYRMRKLNKGHKCTIGMVNSSINKTIDALELIIKNELSFTENNKDLLELQYLKCFNRKLTNYYKENDMKALYEYERADIKSIIRQKIINNINPIISDPIINFSFNELINKPLDNLLKIFFSKNSIEHVMQTQTEVQV
jgi:hypothetical protein